MNRNTPTFRLHARGIWFCRWGGKDHYFTANREESYEQYLESLQAWARWRRRRDDMRLPKPGAEVTIQELHDRFVANRESEGGPDRAAFYRKHLKRFVAAYGPIIASDFRPVMLQRLKDAMLMARKSNRTTNHDIQAVRTMLQWAMDMEVIGPVNVRAVKKMPLGPIPDKSWPVSRVRQFILSCPHRNLRAWLAVCYLCGLRPKEMVRIMTGQGRWVDRGVMAIPNKSRVVRIERHVLFSAEAFRWWRACRPQWSRLDSFSQACRAVQGVGPHQLRHSAGTALMLAGVPRDDADSILGHYPRAVSVTYMRMQWRRLRLLASRLTLEDSSSYCILPLTPGSTPTMR